MNSGIYVITNRVNGKAYIGSTIDFERRRDEHRDALQQDKHSNTHLQSSWNKYGEEVFEFSVIEYVDNLDELTEVEQFWMDIYREEGKELYNFGLAADCPMRGQKFTEEQKQKLSKAMMGNQNGLGYKHSKETKRRIGEGNTGKRRSKNLRLRISKAMMGRKRGPMPEKIKRKISKALTGRKFSKKHRYMISKAMKGKKRSKEARRAISEAMMGHSVSKESRRKTGEAHAKPYPAFIHKETGETIPAGFNLSALCIERELGQEGMRMVKNKKQYSHRGWVLVDDE